MLALGLTVEMPSPKRPSLLAVLLRDTLPPTATPTLGDIVLVDSFEAPTIEDNWAIQLRDLSKATSGRVSSLKPDIIVVRRADISPRASNLDGPRFRLLGTGAVTAAATILLPTTRLRTGKECGAAYGSLKADLDAAAATLVTRKYIAAAAAALAGLVADRE